MAAVLNLLPRKWNLIGRVSVSDLDNSCFQFQFDDKENLRKVLHLRPSHFGRWMIILQRWESIISPSFPSQIPLRISFKDSLLYYRHEKVVRNIGMELGELDDYHVSRLSARVRVLLDGLNPLIMETVLEYDFGEECAILLEYEKLENYCKCCFRLSQLRSQSFGERPHPGGI